jgi:hypothetical protein
VYGGGFRTAGARFHDCLTFSRVIKWIRLGKRKRGSAVALGMVLRDSRLRLSVERSSTKLRTRTVYNAQFVLYGWTWD